MDGSVSYWLGLEVRTESDADCTNNVIIILLLSLQADCLPGDADHQPAGQSVRPAWTM